nr:unnamed protein product [Callosobruchus chinensis]
MLMYFIRM